ncbi:MAG: sce7726 family protein [Phycisphaerae bacterium]|nr:sce7726 family protein [Phycisphaerae bacterium]
MNDVQVRENFHRKRLRRQHAHSRTLVVNELGLNHGRCRADIAIINGQLVGYEIKSDEDSLRRLDGQVKSYNAVFDRVFMIVGERHLENARKQVPQWWGLILFVRGPRGAINFRTLRNARRNTRQDPISVARLLWRNEVVEILHRRGVPPHVLRQPRAHLYEHLTSVLDIQGLRRTVRKYLRTRRNWRYRA